MYLLLDNLFWGYIGRILMLSTCFTLISIFLILFFYRKHVLSWTDSSLLLYCQLLFSGFFLWWTLLFFVQIFLFNFNFNLFLLFLFLFLFFHYLFCWYLFFGILFNLNSILEYLSFWRCWGLWRLKSFIMLCTLFVYLSLWYLFFHWNNF